MELGKILKSISERFTESHERIITKSAWEALEDEGQRTRGVRIVGDMHMVKLNGRCRMEFDHYLLPFLSNLWFLNHLQRSSIDWLV